MLKAKTAEQLQHAVGDGLVPWLGLSIALDLLFNLNVLMGR